MKRGKFIVIDGIEGAGKTTLLQKLPALFPNLKLAVTREPGGTPYAEAIRNLFVSDIAKDASAETQFGLAWAARHDHLHKKIGPLLRQGVSVISDRFDSTTYAIQIYGQNGRHLEKLFWQTREIFLGRIKPHLYIFLDAAVEVGMKRTLERRAALSHYDRRGKAFHESVRRGFKAFFARVPHATIDANRPLADVEADLAALVKKTLRS